MSILAKTAILFSLLAVTGAAPVFAEDLPPPQNLPVRLARPTVISFGGLWPRVPGLSVERQLTDRLGLGAHVGYAVFVGDIGLFGRWYFSDEPGSWYAEALTSWSMPFGLGLNGLFGWQYRSPDGLTFNFGAGLGITTLSNPTPVPDIWGLINVDAGIGYAF